MSEFLKRGNPFNPEEPKKEKGLRAVQIPNATNTGRNRFLPIGLMNKWAALRLAAVMTVGVIGGSSDRFAEQHSTVEQSYGQSVDNLLGITESLESYTDSYQQIFSGIADFLVDKNLEQILGYALYASFLPYTTRAFYRAGRAFLSYQPKIDGSQNEPDVFLNKLSRPQISLTDRLSAAGMTLLDDDSIGKSLFSLSAASVTSAAFPRGLGANDVSLTIILGGVVIAALTAWKEIDREDEEVYGAILQALTPVTAGVIAGMQASGMIELDESITPALVPSAIGGLLALWANNKMGNLSRKIVDGQWQSLDGVPSTFDGFVIALESKRLVRKARSLKEAVMEGRIAVNILNQGGLLDQAFDALEKAYSKDDKLKPDELDIPLSVLKEQIQQDLHGYINKRVVSQVDNSEEYEERGGRGRARSAKTSVFSR